MVVVVVVVVVVAVVVVGVTSAVFFLGSVVVENRHRWCFRVFLQFSEQQAP